LILNGGIEFDRHSVSAELQFSFPDRPCCHVKISFERSESRRLFDRNAAIESNASGLHDDVIVDGFGPADHRLHLLYRPAKRDCKFFVAAIKALIAQGLEHVLSFVLIGSFIVNFLVEHLHTLLCSIPYHKDFRKR
jgi:hypothetical protein